MSIGVSMLDVGLLKGDAVAEAKEGWRVAALKVTATFESDAGEEVVRQATDRWSP